MKKNRLQNTKSNFLCIALNRVLTLGDYSTGDCVVVALKIIDFENENEIWKRKRKRKQHETKTKTKRNFKGKI